jgi:hypothetical protein
MPSRAGPHEVAITGIHKCRASSAWSWVTPGEVDVFVQGATLDETPGTRLPLVLAPSAAKPNTIGGAHVPAQSAAQNGNRDTSCREPASATYVDSRSMTKCSWAPSGWTSHRTRAVHMHRRESFIITRRQKSGFSSAVVAAPNGKERSAWNGPRSTDPIGWLVEVLRGVCFHANNLSRSGAGTLGCIWLGARAACPGCLRFSRLGWPVSNRILRK